MAAGKLRWVGQTVCMGIKTGKGRNSHGFSGGRKTQVPNFGGTLKERGDVKVSSRWHGQGSRSGLHARLSLEGMLHRQDRDNSQNDSEMKIPSETVTGQVNQGRS